jgi:hypothetical protein
MLREQETSRRSTKVTVRFNDHEHAGLLLIMLKQHCSASQAIRALVLDKAHEYVVSESPLEASAQAIP